MIWALTAERLCSTVTVSLSNCQRLFKTRSTNNQGKLYSNDYISYNIYNPNKTLI